MKYLSVLLLACAAAFTGCQNREATSSKQKTNIAISGVQQGNNSPSRGQTTSTSQLAAPLPPENEEAVYAADAAQPFDSLIFGTVSRSDGAPIEHGKIVVYKSGIPRSEYVRFSIPADGKFKIGVNSDLRYSLEVLADNITTGRYLIPSSITWEKSQSASARYKNQLKLNLEFPPIGTVEGKVVDASDSPLADTLVSFALPEKPGDISSKLLLQNVQTTTTLDGTFRIEKAPVGIGSVMAKAPEYMPITQDNISCPTSEPLLLKVYQRGGTLTGKVLEHATEAPVDGAQVKIIPTLNQGLPVAFRSVLPQLSAATDSAGNFEIKNVPPISFKLETTKTTPKLIEPAWTLASKPILKINEKQTTDVKIHLYGGHRVIGNVFDKETNEPLANVKVSLPNEPADKAVTSSADGTFTLPGVIRESNLKLSLDGYIPYEEKITVSPSNPNNLDIEIDIPMVQVIKISGMVKTRDGAPIPGATITYATSPYEMGLGKKVKSKSDGTYELEFPPLSNFISKIEAEGFSPTQSEILETGIEDVNSFDFVLDRGITLAGEIVDETGSPIPDVIVSSNITIRDSNRQVTSPKQVGNSDLLGKFTASNLHPNAELSFKHDNYVFHELKLIDFDLQPGDSKNDLKIVLTKGEIISGTAETESGKIPTNLQIDLRSRDNRYSFMNVDPGTGEFIKKNLKKGTYELHSNSNRFKPITVDSGTTGIKIIVPDSNVSDNPKTSGEKKKLSLIGNIIDKKTKKQVNNYKLKFNPTSEKPKIDSSNPSHFTVSGLESGTTYELIITSPEHIPTKFTFEVPKEDETFEEEFELEVGGSVTGTLLNASDKKPIANTVVQIFNITETNIYNWLNVPDRPLAYTVSDNEGKFAIHGIREGSVNLVVKPKSDFAHLSQALTITNDLTNNLGEILLYQGANLTGRFLNSKGEPLAGKTISLNSNEGSLRQHKSIVTNEKGEYKFQNVPNGLYTLYSESPKVSAKIEIKNYEDTVFDLSLGGVTLVAEFDKRPDQNIHSITITNKLTKNSISATIYSETNIKNLVPGNYTYTIYAFLNHQFPIVTSGELLVPDEEEFHYTFNIPKGRILGNLTDSGGKPIRDAIITIELNGNTVNRNNMLRTMPDGSFEIDFLNTGTYTVIASTTDRGSAVRSGIVVGQNDVEVKLTLSDKTGSIESLVIDGDSGEPVREAQCTIIDEAGSPFHHNANRNRDGIMKISNIPEGRYNITISAPNYTSTVRRIKVEADKTATLDDVLYKAGNIVWTLSNADGSPANGILVQVKAETPKAQFDNRTVRSDANGQIIIEGLSEGNYTLTATKNEVSVSERFTIVQGEVATKENKVKDW